MTLNSQKIHPPKTTNKTKKKNQLHETESSLGKGSRTPETIRWDYMTLARTSRFKGGPLLTERLNYHHKYEIHSMISMH